MGVYVIINLFAKDEPNAPDQIKAALLDARAVYLKDPGTVEWLPVQDSSNKRHFQVFEKFDSDNVSLLCIPLPPPFLEFF